MTEDQRPGQQLSSRWAGATDALPQSLDQLTGPSDGIVELPFDLAWSGRRRFDLTDAAQRHLYEMTVLNSAFEPQHYTRWLNGQMLTSDWLSLFLPRPMRRVWQERFPELAGDA